jgi:small multidrug resistance family-3 protein
MKLHPNIVTLLFLILATTLEVCGDALVRKVIHEYTGTYRVICALISAVLLFGYGFTLNLAPVDFGKVVGLYIATLFIVWQVISYFTFGSVPPFSVIIGGLLIISGGLIVTFARF